MAESKAQAWAAKTPEDRVKLYRTLRTVFRETAALVPDGEANALMMVARNLGGAASRVVAQIDREKGPCCFHAKMYGSCECR